MLIRLPSDSSEVAEPVSVAEARAHLRVFHTNDDDLIERLIRAARDYVEQFTQRALVAASYRDTRTGFESRFTLPLWPVESVDAITYLDDDEVRQTVAVEDYSFDGDRLVIRAVDGWPSGSEVNIEFTTAPGEVPEALKHAILMIVADLYENAEANIVGTIVSPNPAVAQMLWACRRGLGA